MLNQISNLGEALSAKEQKAINGGGARYCCEWCSDGTCNGWGSNPLNACAFALPC